ncbi:APH(3'') family aminoglycoside O-phosphotransferase [Actinocatenispora rupis]|uniref:Putative streptomycin phosphotransferase n=1 Tax=Actinocatenispora rupis TaxID=519421 RepID=A0A8J3N940_9ACTN|nr:APH(3'') family aminoglycoside O-phosphotransferase [Actinocatenispora rupis]GID10954.1 putative streptomycin phosphotransferase [Actinocatenispora rupis]
MTDPEVPRRFAAWSPVTDGESGDLVFRSPDRTRYAKCASPARADLLAAERDRITWLAGTGVPGATVLDWVADDAGAYLVTSAVPGVPADRVSPAGLRRAWPSVTAAVRRLHALPTAACPYDRGLGWMLARARDVVARGAVHPEFLPVEQRTTPPAELLARLAGQADRRRAQEAADTVVCHGDLCLPNILLDPATGAVIGFVDLGRLGRADRHADLALLSVTARSTWPDEATATAAEADFARGYGMVPDPDRQRFYLHLDPLTWD